MRAGSHIGWPASNAYLEAWERFCALRLSRLLFTIPSSALPPPTMPSASARKFTHIAAQDLGPALKQLAQSRGLQVLYLSTTVRDVRTRGANGDITANEAFDQLLDGTGLTYRYLDENTVTVIPLSDASPSEGAGASLPVPAGKCSRRKFARAARQESWLR